METVAAISTLTMNPALDVTTATARVAAMHKLRCATPRYDPGGGGINVARVVHILGGAATAIYPAGGPAGQVLQALLEEQGVAQCVLPIAGRTRESFAVDERTTGRQFRFVLPGPNISRDEQQRCVEALGSVQPQPAFIVASGSLPPGVSGEFLARVACLAREMGAKLILDTSGDALLHAGREGVYLMKPNLRELSQLIGRDLHDEHDQIAAGRQVLEEGHAEVMVLSLGADGALLICQDVTERLAAPDVPIRSAVGAGDSMVGAMVLALARGDELRNAVRFGVAAGAAALMTEGTELCRREDAERLYDPLKPATG